MSASKKTTVEQLAQELSTVKELLRQQAEDHAKQIKELTALIHRPEGRTLTPKLEHFTGDSDTIDIWLLNVETAARHYCDEDRIRLAEMHFRGAAALWLRELTLTGEPTPTTWSAWTDRLRRRFGPINAEQHYRDQLSKLRQTGKVKDYTAKFMTLAAQLPDISSQQKLYMYTQGLRDAVRYEVMARRPTTFAEATQLADMYDAFRPLSYTMVPGTSTEVNTANDQQHEELDFVRGGDWRGATGRQLGPRSGRRDERPTTMTTLPERRTCFGCGRRGHLIAVCPERQQPFNQKSGYTQRGGGQRCWEHPQQQHPNGLSL